MARKNETTKEEALQKKEAPGALQQYDWGEDAGEGYEGQTEEDRSVPFLNVLQSGSKQVKEGGLPNAKGGMLHNSATDDLYDGKEGVLFVPCLTRHVFVEWRPRAQGGGYVGQYEIDDEVVAKAKEASKEFGKYNTPNGNELTETFYVFAVLCSPSGEPISPIILHFESKKIKPYKAWNTKTGSYLHPVKDEEGNLLKKVQPPLFAHTCKITTWLDKSSPKGDFYNVALSPAKTSEDGTPSVAASLLQMDSAAYQAAKDFKTLIQSGAVKVSYDRQDDGRPDESEKEKPAHF